ncbi:hypothetical protein NPIL_467331 [Nephila pilipes]|uniref:Uncharacterized protein n=1 Tax=Nephila pilipes TaxID=299642 RepID=A0A8X6QDL8_NEPPI|nr:hypothetical protein NPIL_467331 [Nephila pilipes]
MENKTMIGRPKDNTPGLFNKLNEGYRNLFRILFIGIHHLGGEVQQKSPPQQQLCYWKRTGCALAVKNRENCYPGDTLCSQRNLVSCISVDFHRHFRDLSNYYTICGHGFRKRLLQSGRTHCTLCGSGSGGGQSHSRHVSHRRDPFLGRNRLGIPSIRNKRGQNEGELSSNKL